MSALTIADEVRGSGWTSGRTLLAVDLAHKGLSAAQIAQELGGTTRVAVAAKLWRMGVKLNGVRRPFGKAPATCSSLPSRTGSAGARALPQLSSLPMPEELAGVGRVLMRDLEPQHCRWPVGDPADPGFAFCGNQRLETRPYCAVHCGVAYLNLPTKTA